MNIRSDVSLSGHSTMGLGGTAAYLVEVTERDEVPEALKWAEEKALPTLMIGSGSNIVWRDEGFPGLVLVNRIKGYDLQPGEGGNFILTIGAGENWDETVAKTVEAGLTGIEALSLIPGTAGATPVQNVGAYGQEISETLVSLEAFDSERGNFVTLQGSDCGFGYRTSRFKTNDHGRFYITTLTLQLKQANPAPPYYASVQAYFEEHGIDEITPQKLREAVIAIRSAKLPDPATIRNTGSFFANPVVTADELARLRSSYPDIPAWTLSDGSAKIAAAWLIEQAGFKDFHDEVTGMATWPRQALVLINEAAGTTADLLAFKQKIVQAVQAKFYITLVQEPELLP